MSINAHRAEYMVMDKISFPSKSLMYCCDCGCSCALTTSSSGGTWIRSVKRKYDEYEQSSRFYIPGFDYLNVARVEIENECAALRETVSSQQQTIHELCIELEEERNAASSAANEAMSMILRLQREKAEIQMEARQFKRFAEEKTAHDAQEIAAYEDLLYKREQAIESLTCEVQAYKHKMMSYGMTESEAEGLKCGWGVNQSFSDDLGVQVESPTCRYPPLRCNLNEKQGQAEDDDVVDVEKYPFGETPRSQDLKNLEHRINQLERTPRSNLDGDFSGTKNVLENVIVGPSPRWLRNSRRFSSDSPSSYPAFGRDMGLDYTTDSPRMGTSFKKLNCVVEELRKADSVSEYEDDISDRVYTIDSVHPRAQYHNVTETKQNTGFYEEYVGTTRGSLNQVDLGDPEVKKLYVRLQALEADRESMRQTIMSMQTDKAQLFLLREIAQQLCKGMSPARHMPVRKQSLIKSFSFMAVLKWVLSFIFCRKKARQTKYTFGLTANNAGLLMLLDNTPQTKHWRRITSTRF